MSPVPRRAPGFGAWGHEPLAGAQVRYLVVTADRLIVFALDRDVRGPYLYRLLRIETERPRADVRSVELGRRLLVRSLTITFANGSQWPLEVSPSRHRLWEPVIAELRLPTAAESVVAPTR